MLVIPLPYPLPSNEAHRLAALHDLRILDTAPSPTFDRLCQMAGQVLGMPIAVVSLLDADRQWLKATCGLDGQVTQTPREHAFCTYTILHDEALIIPDASADLRFRDNPFVIGEPHIRFYAGVPLSLAPGIRVGSLCVIDRKPRDFASSKVSLLKQFARLIVGELWLHRLKTKGLAMEPEELRDELDFTIEPQITGAQMRAARGLLRWSVEALARRAGVSVNTVKRAELQDGPSSVRFEKVRAIAQALREGGVDWIFSPGLKPGVRPSMLE